VNDADIFEYFPQWTSRVKIKGTGRDPLGLSRVSEAFTNFLLPQIISTTHRARYYSFYTWAIWDIQNLRKTKAKKRSFEDEFQRREAAFAIASSLGRKFDLSIIGIEQVECALASPVGREKIDTEFRVLPSNTLGGLGQYYVGCLTELGLISRDDVGIPVVSSELGQQLADAFIASTVSAPYMQDNWRNRRYIPQKILQDSAKTLSLDSIAVTSSTSEREALINLFFDLEKKPSASFPLNRQATLGMFLHLLKACEEKKICITRRDVNEDLMIFLPYYYHKLVNANQITIPYKLPKVFKEVLVFWEQFCAHQFLAYALEEFLASMLEILTIHPEGLTKSDLVNQLVSCEFIKDLNGYLKSDCSKPYSLLCGIGIRGIPDQSMSDAVSRAFNADNEINEWNLCWDDENPPETRLCRAILLIAILYGKWRGHRDDDIFIQIEKKANSEIWLGTLFIWIDAWHNEQLDWRTAIEQLLERIILRHDQVKFQKRKLEASWFEYSHGRIIKLQKIIPKFRQSRHGSATTILQDLGLIKHSGLDQSLELTAKGESVLRKVIQLRS
jgi:hypothetical protein